MMIINEKEYIDIRGTLEKVFNLDAQLPEQVFKSDYSDFYFYQDNILSKEFWASLQKSVLNTGEQELVISVLEPEPRRYFYGDYRTLKLSINASPDEYWRALNMDSPFVPEGITDLILFSSVSVVFPTSIEWAIWQDRNLELSIIGFKKPVEGKFSLGGWPWFSAEEVVDKLLPAIFWVDGNIVPVPIVEKLIKNYKS